MFDEDLAIELAAEPDLTLLCGRYEGIDDRVREHLVLLHGAAEAQ